MHRAAVSIQRVQFHFASKLPAMLSALEAQNQDQTPCRRARRKHGTARYVGNGQNRWTCVHVDDLTDLYLLALEKASVAPIVNGASGAAIPLMEIARAANEGAGAEGRVAEWPLE